MTIETEGPMLVTNITINNILFIHVYISIPHKQTKEQS